MSIQEIMTKSVVTAPESSSLLQLRARLLELRISRIVITNNEGKAVGIVSVKDLLRYALQDTSGRELSEVKANEIMSRPLITVTPSTSLKEASKKMIQKRVSSLVVMENERVVGIVTKTDICAFFAVNMRQRFKVKEWMSTPALTVKASQPISFALYLMQNKGISHLIVKNDELLGVLSVKEVIGVLPFLRTKKETVFESGVIVPREFLHLLTVGDFTTKQILTVNEEEELAQAAKLMLVHKVSALPVVNRELVGIVTKTDIVRASSSLSE